MNLNFKVIISTFQIITKSTPVVKWRKKRNLKKLSSKLHAELYEKLKDERGVEGLFNFLIKNEIFEKYSSEVTNPQIGNSTRKILEQYDYSAKNNLSKEQYGLYTKLFNYLEDILKKSKMTEISDPEVLKSLSQVKIMLDNNTEVNNISKVLMQNKKTFDFKLENIEPFYIDSDKEILIKLSRHTKNLSNGYEDRIKKEVQNKDDLIKYLTRFLAGSNRDKILPRFLFYDEEIEYHKKERDKYSKLLDSDSKFAFAFSKASDDLIRAKEKLKEVEMMLMLFLTQEILYSYYPIKSAERVIDFIEECYQYGITSSFKQNDRLKINAYFKNSDFSFFIPRKAVENMNEIDQQCIKGFYGEKFDIHSFRQEDRLPFVVAASKNIYNRIENIKINSVKELDLGKLKFTVEYTSE